MVATPSLPVSDVQELVRYAKANPGRLNYGAAIGIGPHFITEMFKIKAGVDIVHVPYRGSGPIITDVLSGQIQLTMSGKSKLYIDNSGGPVTFYVTGGVSLAGTAKVYIADPDPEHFAIYVAGTAPVDLECGTPGLYGVVYAPTSSVLIGGSAQFSGAFVGQDVSLDGSATVHYDQALRGQ